MKSYHKVKVLSSKRQIKEKYVNSGCTSTFITEAVGSEWLIPDIIKYILCIKLNHMKLL